MTVTDAPALRAGGLALALAAAAGAAAPVGATLGTPFTLRPGSTAVVQGEDLEVGFDRVVSESRCPRDAHCVAPGRAVVRVWLVKAPRARADHDLHTDPPAAAEAQYAGYRLRLVALDPWPEGDRPARPSDYVATLVVVR